MPPGGIPAVTHADVLRYEEIAAVVQVAAQAGVRDVRLTGGEPLVRLDIAVLVKMLSSIPGIQDISMTTNGIYLERLARPLKDAGLSRVNISLDTLRPERFRAITRGGSFEQTWQGILAAEEAGLLPIKINVVAMRGVNDDELLDLARLAIDHAWHVRFIEVMPVGHLTAWGEGFPAPEDTFLSIAEIRERLTPLGLESIQSRSGTGPAVEFAVPGGKGRVGFISPISQHFCEECNRLRLTADGNLRPCLFSDLEIPLREALRRGESILPYLEQAVGLKPRSHLLVEKDRPQSRCMMQIGG
jgi:cyclic pyranopterin phosphate synthase